MKPNTQKITKNAENKKHTTNHTKYTTNRQQIYTHITNTTPTIT